MAVGQRRARITMNQENLADFEQIYSGYWLLDSLGYVLCTIRDKAGLNIIDKKSIQLFASLLVSHDRPPCESG